MTRRTRARFDRQRGVALVLFALVLSGICAVIALAIDINLAYAARDQARQYVRLAVLAGAEEYFDNQPCGGLPCSHTQRLDRAVARVNQLSNANRLLSDRNQTAEAGVVSAADKGLLEAGYWKTDAIACPTSDPCFVPYDNGTARPTAFRITGSFYERISTRFARGLFGIERFRPKVMATALVIPRHVVFLVDGSPSTVRETFLQWTPGAAGETPPAGQGHEYAYFPSTLNGTPVSHHDYSWQWLATNHPTRSAAIPAPTDPSINFADDYRLKLSLGDDHFNLNSLYQQYHPDPSVSAMYAAADPGLWYRAHVFRAGHPGPEPLATIFYGIREAIQRLKERRVSGDRASVIFFDHQLSWPRMTKLIDSLDYLIDFTKFTPAVDGTEIVADDPSSPPDPTGAAPGLERTIRHGLYPGLATFTNLTMAVSEAATQLGTQEDAAISSKAIVLISDGLINCCSHAQCAPGCNNVYAHYQQGMAELTAVVRDQLVPHGISLHVIAVGKNIAPHTVDVGKRDSSGALITPAQCYTDSEYRALKNNPDPFGFTRGGDSTGAPYPNSAAWDAAFASMSPGNPFYQANADLYRLAVISQGVWIPLRPIAAGCDPANVSCMNGTRRETDPQCRTLYQQIDDGMNDAIGDTPFRIVEAE